MSTLPVIEPIAPTLIVKPFHRAGWVYEEKVDGWRGIEAWVFVPIEAQEALDLPKWRAPGRGAAPPAIDQACVAVAQEPPAPPAQTAGRAADDLGGLRSIASGG